MPRAIPVVLLALLATVVAGCGGSTSAPPALPAAAAVGPAPAPVEAHIDPASLVDRTGATLAIKQRVRSYERAVFLGRSGVVCRSLTPAAKAQLARSEPEGLRTCAHLARFAGHWYTELRRLAAGNPTGLRKADRIVRHAPVTVDEVGLTTARAHVTGSGGRAIQLRKLDGVWRIDHLSLGGGGCGCGS